MWDTTIHVGDLLTLIGVVIAFVMLKLTMRTEHDANVRRLTKIETKVGMIYRWFEQHIVMRGGNLTTKEGEEDSNDHG